MFKGWRDEEGTLRETEDYPGRAEETESQSLRIPGKSAFKR